MTYDGGQNCYTAPVLHKLLACLHKQDKLLKVVPPSLWPIAKGRLPALRVHERLWLHVLDMFFLRFRHDEDQLSRVDAIGRGAAEVCWPTLWDVRVFVGDELTVIWM